MMCNRIKNSYINSVAKTSLKRICSKVGLGDFVDMSIIESYRNVVRKYDIRFESCMTDDWSTFLASSSTPSIPATLLNTKEL